MRTGLIIAVGAAVLVAGGGYAVWQGSDVERAKRDVQEMLVDPDSAIFSSVEKCIDGSQLAFIAGYVNFKNSMGGFTGKQQFVSVTTGHGFISEVHNMKIGEDLNIAYHLHQAKNYATKHPMTCAEQLTSAYNANNSDGRGTSKSPPLLLGEAQALPDVDVDLSELQRSLDAGDVAFKERMDALEKEAQKLSNGSTTIDP